jgi:hypothetical protein
MHRFYRNFFKCVDDKVINRPSRRRGRLLCQQCTKIKFSGYECMQRDIQQENRMNTLTLTISEDKKII